MTSTEIEPAGRMPVKVGVPIEGLDEAFRLSKNLALASVMPDSLRGKASDVLAIVLYGQELGLAPMQSIQGIYVVKGKPQLASQTWVALARRAGHKVRIVESTDKTCTVTIVRADDPDYPHTETFTLDDAVRAGLCSIRDGKAYARSKGGDALPWEAYTQTMLRNRAISNAGKFACPEVAQGFAIEGDYDYIPDSGPAATATRPEHHGDTADLAAHDNVVDAEVVPDPDELAEHVAALQAEFEQPAADGE